MAVKHESLPVLTVQFHPESIMSLENDAGHRLIENITSRIAKTKIVDGEDKPALGIKRRVATKNKNSC